MINSPRFMDVSASVHPIVGIAYLNFIFLFLLFVVFFSFFAQPTGYEIRLPFSGGEGVSEENRVTISITSENVLYFNDKVVTLNDLKKGLLRTRLSDVVVYLRVDRRSSMGRLSDVWDLCKALGVSRVKVVAQQDH